MHWRDHILEIHVKGEDGWKVGTGFAVGIGRILTARHVLISQDNRPPVEIWARWEGYSKEEDFNEDARSQWADKFPGYFSAELLWHDEPLDISILKVPHPVDAKYINLSPKMMFRRETRESRGFPSGAKVGEFSEGINFHGQHYPRVRGQRDAQFDPVNPPDDLGNWSGMSGAPLIDEEDACADAVVVLAREAMGEARVLNVVSVHDIFGAEGFWPQYEEGLSDGYTVSSEEVQKKLRFHQDECRDLCEDSLAILQEEARFFRRLTRSLEIDPAIDCEPKELRDECLDRLVADPKRGLDALGKLEAKSRGDGAHKSLCALIQNLTLLLLSDIEAPVLLLGNTLSGMIEIAPGNPTGLEVRAAQIDGRRLQLQEHRRADAEIPAGRFALNVVSAEVGPRGSAPTNPSERDLLARSGMRAPASREIVEQFMVKKLPLLVGARRSPLSESDKAELNNAFVLNRSVNQTRYLAHLCGLPQLLQEQSDKLATYFRQTYPAVRIIPIDIRKWDEDVSRFSAVINTILVVPDDQE
ncbi:MAG: hypothetical protein CMI67_04965 [Pelagibaca sp.]|nr:hypothetical protein [Pelagibaca sp.]